VSAVEALRAAQDAGVQITVDGDRLSLSADAKPPPAVLDLLTKYKAEVIAYLNSAGGCWDIEDWITYYGERAGIAEFDEELSQAQAMAYAYECCIGEWLVRNAICIVCGLIATSYDPVIPIGTDTMGYASIHSGCWRDSHAAGLRKARAALKQMGITREGAKALDDRADDYPR